MDHPTFRLEEWTQYFDNLYKVILKTADLAEAEIFFCLLKNGNTLLWQERDCDKVIFQKISAEFNYLWMKQIKKETYEIFWNSLDSGGGVTRSRATRGGQGRREEISLGRKYRDSISQASKEEVILKKAKKKGTRGVQQDCPLLGWAGL